MKFKRLAAYAAAAVTVAVTAVAGANPASAADPAGNWRAYGNTSPTLHSPSVWVCGDTAPITSGVVAQACVVRGKGDPPDVESTLVQAAVIVRNNRSGVYTAEAAAELDTWPGLQFYKRWICPASGIAPNSWSVCFGVTFNYFDRMQAKGGVNGTSLPTSPEV
ncbi:hypothetical protein [Actinoplanes sp. NPDC051411]|uniref:hypothetical protein n=1 Tax=Actinoplanes sp. NPDC051411 TaxID=3155522 RepID=UPI0034428474